MCGCVTQAQPVNELYYRGWHNLNAVLDDLLARRGLADASEVLIGGDSAGGLATFYHIDHMAEAVRRASADALVVGMPDSGYWPDDNDLKFTGTFTAMLETHNGTAALPAACLAALGGNRTACLFPQYFAHLIETPPVALRG